MIFQRKFLVNKLSIRKSEIKLDSILLNKKNYKQQSSFPQIPFENILIQHIELAEVYVWLQSDFENHLLLKGSISIDKINIGDVNKPFSAGNLNLVAIKSILTDINYFIPEAYHTMQIKKLLLDSKKGVLQIDSLKIVPKFSKSEGKKVEQTHRIEATIAGITVIKPDIMKLRDSFKINHSSFF